MASAVRPEAVSGGQANADEVAEPPNKVAAGPHIRWGERVPSKYADLCTTAPLRANWSLPLLGKFCGGGEEPHRTAKRQGAADEFALTVR